MRSLKFLILTLLICLPAQAAPVADFLDFSLLDSPGGSVVLPGRLYAPPSAAIGPRPLIVFLHGSGAAGTNNTSQVNASIDNLLAEAKLRGAFLYAPQTATTWASETVTDQVMTMIARAKTDYPIVATQVYMTGISMGGGGAWNMLSRYGSEFAAGLPICGVGVAADYLAANLVGKPIWAFHGKLDTSVDISFSRSRVNGILTANGRSTQSFNSDPVDWYFNWATLRLQYTEFANEGHNIWDRVYSTTAVYDWLFAQNLPQPVQVMCDDFTDADRAGWFEVDDGTSTLSVNPSSPIVGGGNSLAFETTDLGMQTFATHFPPVTLAKSGDSVTLEFKARRTGTGFQDRGFRFGLYQSASQQFTADADQDQALISLEDAGYFAVLDSGASASTDSAVLRRNTGETSGTNERLLNGTTLASDDNGSGDDPLMFSTDKDFTYVLSITRVGNTLKLLLENDETLAAGSGSLAFTETAPATYTFDTLYFGQRASTAGGANFVIDDVCVSKLIAPGTVHVPITEQFTGGNPPDVANQSIAFIPDGSSSYYRTCKLLSTTFPTDPAGGTAVALTGNGSSSVNLSATPVSLYGTSYSSVFINANGNLTFHTADWTFAETLDIHFNQPRISGWFHDLDPTLGGTVSYRILADRVAFTYADISVANLLANKVNFQIEMFTNGTGIIRITHLATQAGVGIVGLSSGPGATPAGFVSTNLSAVSNCVIDDLRLLTFGPGNPAGSGDLDDPDYDGISNLLEFALAGYDPLVPNASVPSLNANTLSFTKRPGLSGLTYIIEDSTDLGVSDPWAEVAGASYVNNDTTISFTFNPGTMNRYFLRLQVR
jgi:predicted esterase